MKAKPLPFDVHAFLAKIGAGRTAISCRKNKKLFSQGDPADAIFYIQDGKIKLTVVSKQGNEAVVGILGANDFFGEGCLAGQSVRMSTATAMSACESCDWRKTHDPGAARRASLFGAVSYPLALPQHSDGGGPRGPALQLQREATGSGTAVAGELWQGRPSRSR